MTLLFSVEPRLWLERPGYSPRHGAPRITRTEFAPYLIMHDLSAFIIQTHINTYILFMLPGTGIIPV